MARARNFCFTLNNYTDADVASVKEWECKYLIFGKEVGESGTPHLQGYVSFANQRTLSSLKKLSGSAHWEAARGTPKQASEYCEKEGDVFEKGVRPLSQVEKGDGEKERWRTALLCVQEDRLDDMDPQILCCSLKNVQFAANALKKRCAEVLDGEMEHQWFVGPAGCGKSYTARKEYPGAYIKDPQERWWDGYNGEEVVIIDDFDKFQIKQGGDMKRWSDRYAFRAPVKNGYILIRPRMIIVTSQYRPDQIWDDHETISAMNRRFKIRSEFTSYVAPQPQAYQRPHVPQRDDDDIDKTPPDPAGADRRPAGGGSDEVEPKGRNEDIHAPPVNEYPTMDDLGLYRM